ncbi:MAG: AraC family transcriptional regulator [Ruminococcus sp.]
MGNLQFHHEKGVYGNSLMYFHTPSTTALDYLFYYNYCGLFYCNSLYRIQRGDNEFYEPYLFIFVKEGCMHLDYKGGHYEAHKNECLLFDCRLAHCYYAENDTVFQYIHFGGNISDYYIQRICENNQHAFTPANPHALTSALSRLLIYTGEPIPQEHIISAGIHQMLSLILASSEIHSSLNGRRVSDAVKYMTAHLSEDITLEDIAGQTGLNPSYFSRLFRRYTDTSPYDYLINLRISHGKMLLMTTAHSILTISEECGFKDPVQFAKIFKKKSGFTPLQFRKSHTSA